MQYYDYNRSSNSLEVYGEGTVAAAPNQVTIILGAETENVNLTEAQLANNNIMNAVLASLDQLKIPRKDIQTISYQVAPQYNFDEGKQIFRGYKVTHLLQITSKEIAQTGRIVDTAVKSGANTVSSVTFAVEHSEQLYNQALASALHDAAQKAAVMASTLGVRITGAPTKVQELSEHRGPTPMYAMSASATPIQPGEIEIKAAVRVEYAYT